MSILSLADFSDIILGYNFRSAIKEDKNGNTYIIQAKNITQGQNISNTEWLTCISFTWDKTSAFLEKHDIVLVSRGTTLWSFRASIFDIDGENFLAAGSVIIIRVKKDIVIPEYISLYLNSDEGQKKILEIVSWATIQTISPPKLRDIKIPIIPLEQQNLIYHLHQNLLAQKRIQNRKHELYSQIISSSLKQLTHS